MKNLIYKYETFKDNLFSGDSIEVKYATFVGISFKESCMQIYFECISDTGELIGVAFNTVFENLEDFNNYHDLYFDLPVVGMVNSLLVPIITVISCFHKNKIDYGKESVYMYDIYGRHVGREADNTVYKLSFRKPAFIAVMKLMQNLYKCNPIDYNTCVDANIVPENRGTIQINNEYKVIVRKAYAVKSEEGFLDKTLGRKLFKVDHMAELGLILISLKNDNNSYRLLLKFPVTNSRVDRIKRDLLSTSLEEFTKFEESLEQEETYVVDDMVNIEYALSADNPMTTMLISTVAYIQDGKDTPNGDKAGKYFEAKQDVFESIFEQIQEQVYD